MSDNYPSQKIFDRLTYWESHDWKEWLTEAMWAWNDDMGSATKQGSEYIFVTGGWSGNEDIISAMRDCTVGWMMTWRSSHRGGKFVFEIRP